MHSNKHGILTLNNIALDECQVLRAVCKAFEAVRGEVAKGGWEACRRCTTLDTASSARVSRLRRIVPWQHVRRQHLSRRTAIGSICCRPKCGSARAEANWHRARGHRRGIEQRHAEQHHREQHASPAPSAPGAAVAAALFCYALRYALRYARYL
eukprot:4106078-Prymnesium_polylepis.1